MLPFDEVLSAQKKISPYIQKTELVRCQPLEKEFKLKGRLFLKCENTQKTGSFKARGAFNAMLNLSADEKKRGVITRSSGNFAQALAYAGSVLKIPTAIVMPSNAPQIKKDATAKYGAQILFSDGGHAEQQEISFEIARKEKLALLSPFDHLHIIAGAGTIALEVWEDLPGVAQYFCPIGGGGLMGGSATAFKALNSNIEVFGIEPQGANDYFLSREAGARYHLDKVHTIADGLRAPQVGELTWPLLQKNVDRLALVSDNEIIQAMRYLHENMNMIVEPSGATAFAALLNHPERLKSGMDAVCILTGGNVDPAALKTWLKAS